MSPSDKKTWKNAATTFLTTARDLVLGSEPQADHDQLAAELHAEHKPATVTERILVDDMARHEWLVRRADRVEKEHLEKNPGDCKTLNNISLYRARARNGFKSALRLLDSRRADALKAAKTELATLQTAVKLAPMQRPHLAEKVLPILDRYSEKSNSARVDELLKKLAVCIGDGPMPSLHTLREELLQY